MASWEKWKDFVPDYKINHGDALREWTAQRGHFKHPDTPVLGGSLRKNTPRKEKFGKAHRVGNVRAT